MNGTAKGPWVVAGSMAALARLEPLVETRRSLQPVLAWTAPVEMLLADPARHLPAGTEGVLVVGGRRRTPRRMLPGLFLRDAASRAVPVGWLPDAGAGLATYARAAARVLTRSQVDRSLIVMGQWEDRFLRSGLRAVRWMEQHQLGESVFHWTADRISREELVSGLRIGQALAVYFGHGRATGWAGYHGVRVDDFTRPWAEPVGALLALCCENAARCRTELSFAERLVLSGMCGAMLAAVTKTRHEDNRIWGPALCEAYAAGSSLTLAGLVTAADVPQELRDCTSYRFIGDPLMRLAGAMGASAKSARVFAPAPDAALPPWEEVSVLG